ENLRGVSDQFHLQHTHETFYYKLRGPDEPAGCAPVLPLREAIEVQGPRVGSDLSWCEEIRKASERIEVLFASAGSAHALPTSAPVRFDSAHILELMREERFGEALSQLRAGSASRSRDPDALLLEATLLVHSAELKSAEDIALQILTVDEFNAGA